MQDGELVENVIIDKLSVDQPRENVQEILDICKTQKGSNACETAFNVYKCYMKNKK